MYIWIILHLHGILSYESCLGALTSPPSKTSAALWDEPRQKTRYRTFCLGREVVGRNTRCGSPSATFGINVEMWSDTLMTLSPTRFKPRSLTSYRAFYFNLVSGFYSTCFVFVQGHLVCLLKLHLHSSFFFFRKVNNNKNNNNNKKGL